MSRDHIPMPVWVDVYDSEQMIEVCGGCAQDWPCPLARANMLEGRP